MTKFPCLKRRKNTIKTLFNKFKRSESGCKINERKLLTYFTAIPVYFLFFSNSWLIAFKLLLLFICFAVPYALFYCFQPNVLKCQEEALKGFKLASFLIGYNINLRSGLVTWQFTRIPIKWFICPHVRIVTFKEINWLQIPGSRAISTDLGDIGPSLSRFNMGPFSVKQTIYLC